MAREDFVVKFAPLGVAIVIAVGSLLSNALLYMRYSTSRPLVKIGDDIITKKQYQDEVDFQTEGGVLRRLVFEKLAANAAAKAHVAPTEQDIDAQIAYMDRTTPEVVSDAKRTPVRYKKLRDEIASTLAVDNLRILGVTVSEAEVKEAYNASKSQFQLPPQANTTLIITENTVDAATAKDLLQRDTPLDIIARQPRLRIVGRDGFNPDFQKLSVETRNQVSRLVFGMKPHDVAVMPFTGKYLVVRLNGIDRGGVQPLSEVLDKVTRIAKLKKALTEEEELATLYQHGNVNFEVDKYAPYFKDVQTATISRKEDK